MKYGCGQGGISYNRRSNGIAGGAAGGANRWSVVCDDNKLDEKGCHGAPDLVIEITFTKPEEEGFVNIMGFDDEISTAMFPELKLEISKEI